MHDGPNHHDHEHELEEEEEHPLWKLDTVIPTSVGIDVGTATSQIIFSRLVLRRLGRELSSRFVVTERKDSLFSPVHFTPYTQGRERIDDQALGRLVDSAYQEAGSLRSKWTPALSFSPARRFGITRGDRRPFSQRSVPVCASAGHNFEALLSAHGSGAVALSADDNVEFLTSISAAAPPSWPWPSGKSSEYGGVSRRRRLLAMDEAGAISVLEPGGQSLAQQGGIPVATRRPRDGGAN